MPPVAAVTAEVIQERIRDLAVEEGFTRGAAKASAGGGDFWDADEVLRWYDEECRHQLRTVLDVAKTTGLFRRVGHPFLAHFADQMAIDVVPGTSDYAMPEDVSPPQNGLLEVISLEVDPDTDSKSGGVHADWREPNEDRYIRRYTSNQPDVDEYFFTIISSADATRVIRIYAYGDEWVPNIDATGTLTYYRDANDSELTSPPTNVDTPDPYNEAPVWGAVGKMMLKQRSPNLAQVMFARRDEAVARIVRVPAPTTEAPR